MRKVTMVGTVRLIVHADEDYDLSELVNDLEVVVQEHVAGKVNMDLIDAEISDLECEDVR